MVVVGIVLGAVLCLVLGLVYYAVVPTPVPPATRASDPAATEPTTAAPDRPGPGALAVELVRCLLTSGLLAGLLTVAGWSGADAGALLGLALCALPVVLLSGSVLWERVPVRRAATHLGDWFIKLVAVGAVVGLFV